MRWRQVRVLGALAAVFLALVAALVAASEGRVPARLGSLTGLGPDCTVSAADGRGTVVDLSTTEAQAAAVGAARAVRGGWSAARAAAQVRTSVGSTGSRLSPEEAAVVSAALTGRSRAALSCRATASAGEEVDTLDRRGLTARAAAVRADLLGRFGRLPMGGYAPGGVRTGHMEGSAHYAGRAVDVFFRPVTPAAKQEGWAVAQYLVANADRLALSTVIYDGRIWTSRRSAEGWREYRVDTGGRSRAVARVLEHRDHVHVDVAP